MNVPIPKNIEETQAKILLGLTLPQGIAVLIDAVIFLLWIANGRAFPKTALITILIFIGFMGFYTYQGMSAPKFLLRMGSFLFRKSGYVFEKTITQKNISKKQKKKEEKQFQKKIKYLQKHGENVISPIELS